MVQVLLRDVVSRGGDAGRPHLCRGGAARHHSEDEAAHARRILPARKGLHETEQVRILNMSQCVVHCSIQRRYELFRVCLHFTQI